MFMRLLYVVATLAFWLLVLSYWQQARQEVHPVTQATPQSAQLTPATSVERAAPAASAAPVGVPAEAVPEKSYSLDELARHARPEDCWLAIDGRVYELTDYLEEHPAPAGVIESWCGREASRAYHTKQRGRTHSAAADRLLADFLRGRLQQP